MRRPTLNRVVDAAVFAFFVLLAALGLPPDPPAGTRLGRLRRELGVPMEALHEALPRELGAR